MQGVISEALLSFPYKLDPKSFEVHIPLDFGTKVYKIQERVGEVQGYTDSPRSVAAAKTIRDQRSDRLHYYIILNVDFVVNHLQDEKRKSLRHIIHHELGHVYYGLLNNHPLKKELSCDLDEIYFVLFEHSELLWEEYVAERTASVSWSPTQDANYRHLLDLAETIVEDIAVKAKEYIASGDALSLSINLQTSTSTLLKVAAMVFASFAAIEDSKRRTRLSILWKDLAHLNFVDQLQDMEEQLSSLYEAYFAGIGGICLLELSNIVLRIWKQLGIHPHYSDVLLRA